ncbi:hypothetical protein ACQR3P_08635 [Rhodococcus sp. IEGM1300]
MIEVVKYPEITKKISTPMNPDGNSDNPPWNINTSKTAIALKPSMSGRYPIERFTVVET